MGTAQDQRVDIGLLQGFQVLFRAGQQLRTAGDPASTKDTKRGQAAVCSSTCGAAANASSYACEVAVASVQITPTRPDRVAATARRAAGKITSTTGTA